MNVFRIEHADDGRGPWATGAVYDYNDAHRCRDYHSAGNQPGPHCRGEYGTPLHKLFNYSEEYRAFFFGFKSRAQLQRWLKSKAGRRAMRDKGMILRVYQIDRKNVAKGNWQIAFRRDCAVPVNTLDLATLKPIGNA